MSVKSSSSPNASLPPAPPSRPVNIYYILEDCLNSTVSATSLTAFAVANTLFILPLCVFVLHVGLQRRRRCSGSDLCTHHMVAVELINMWGIGLICCGIHAELQQVKMAGVFLFVTHLSAQMLFHTLTCVERYLAAVHPIAYMKLKKGRGVRIRKAAVGCAWFLSAVGLGFFNVDDLAFIYVACYCVIALVLCVVCFCSLSVLCVLIRPGPGGGAWGRQQADQTKLRAFYTIGAILGVLVFRFGGNVIMTAVYASSRVAGADRCLVWLSVVWMGLPSSLVLPLLFLQRAGRLVCRKSHRHSGRRSERFAQN